MRRSPCASHLAEELSGASHLISPSPQGRQLFNQQVATWLEENGHMLISGPGTRSPVCRAQVFSLALVCLRPGSAESIQPCPLITKTL
jgi:hypothetical protein